MKTILIALLLFAAVPANACINESEPFEEEHRADYGQSPVEFLREQLDAQPSSKIVGPKSGQLISPDLDTEFVTSQHDAVSEIYSGNFKVAIEKLQALEASHPNDYRTAANLGTAYELIGDNKNALHWISEGIKRNEDSHHGTEWLHKQILEAKIAMEIDPDYLKTNHILPIEKSVVRYTSSYADNLDRALHYQLGERMLFVKPLDPVVADLLYSFAIVEFQSGAPGAAIELLKLAQEYGYLNSTDLDEKLAQYRIVLYKQWAAKVIKIVVACAFLVASYFVARFMVRRMNPAPITGDISGP